MLTFLLPLLTPKWQVWNMTMFQELPSLKGAPWKQWESGRCQGPFNGCHSHYSWVGQGATEAVFSQSQYQEHTNVHIRFTLGTRRASGVPNENLGGAGDVKTMSQSVSIANHAQEWRTLHSENCLTEKPISLVKFSLPDTKVYILVLHK